MGRSPESDISDVDRLVAVIIYNSSLYQVLCHMTRRETQAGCKQANSDLDAFMGLVMILLGPVLSTISAVNSLSTDLLSADKL